MLAEALTKIKRFRHTTLAQVEIQRSILVGNGTTSRLIPKDILLPTGDCYLQPNVQSIRPVYDFCC